MLLKGLPAFMFFSRKPNTNAMRQVSWLSLLHFTFPSFGQWYIEMRLQALQLREQPPFFTGFPFNSSNEETLSWANIERKSLVDKFIALDLQRMLRTWAVKTLVHKGLRNVGEKRMSSFY